MGTLNTEHPTTNQGNHMNKQVIHTALIALAAFAVCKMVQKVVPIPFVGAYLPGGASAAA